MTAKENDTPIADLLLKQLRNEPLSNDEQQQLHQWQQASSYNEAAAKQSLDHHQMMTMLQQVYSYNKEELWQSVMANTKTLQPQQSPLRRLWPRMAAAAAVIILAVTAVLFLNRTPGKRPGVEANIAVADTIMPGSNKAVLSVGNAMPVELASGKSGIAIDGNNIVYSDGSAVAGTTASQSTVLNLLQTPNGGQYQALLPDGSKIWLNAASSVQFPSRFNTNERRITVTGEVYIEVADNKNQPFYIATPATTIQVLGTSMNINAYNNEPYEQTTLVNGKIRVTGNQTTPQQQPILLYPGQLLQAGQGKIQTVQADLTKVLAWKNGLFNFEDTDIETVMRQLARWYNIQVVFEGPVPKRNLAGSMDRNLTLNQVLNALSSLNFKYRHEKNKLIIL